MIFIAGISIAVLIEFLLIGKKNKSGADTILTAWMFLITAHLFLFYLQFTGEIYNFPFLLGISLPFPLLHGVFLYLYVGSVTDQLPARKSVLALHFLPAGAMYLYLVAFFLLPAEQKISVYQNRGAGYETFNVLRSVAMLLSGVVYVTWSILLLRRHRRRILDQFSYQDKIDLQWLQILTWGMGGIWLLTLFQNEAILFGGVTVFVFLIGFFGIRQVRIFAPAHTPLPEPSLPEPIEPVPPAPVSVSIPEPAAPPVETEKEKYAKSGLTPELSEKLYPELLRLMKEENLYKRNDLSVDDLALRLKTHPNYVSQIINEREGKNFYDFVNQYRIDEFKRLIAIPNNRNMTLLSLAFDCGFNSKSSFNRYFKKSTGKTPSEYFTGIPQSGAE